MSNKVEEAAAVYGTPPMAADLAALERVIAALRPSVSSLLEVVRRYSATQGTAPSELPALQAEVARRATAAEAEVLSKAGPLLSSETLARRLGLTRQAVNERKKSGQLLAVSLSGRRGDFFPEFQLDGGAVRPWIPALLKNATAGWEALAFLTARRASLGGESHLERLRRGREGAAEALLADADALLR